jgi:hypothetical protein
MKESRISMLLLVSLSMLLLAFVLLFIWAFSFYKQANKNMVPAVIVVKDSTAIAGNIRDSLQKIYTSTINNLNRDLDATRVNADVFEQDMDAKLQSFYTLKNEIETILQKGRSSAADIDNARAKIQELQQRLQDLRTRYVDVTEENLRLSKLLQKLSVSLPVASAKNTSSPVSQKTDKPPGNTMFVISAIQLKAMTLQGGREQETADALQTDELRGSFECKNAAASVEGEEMYVIILQPDGKAIKQSPWASGLFETGEGRKIYSSRLRFDYIKGETKRLNFSINAEGFQKGNYIMQLYYKGKMIAKTSTSLS